MQLEPVDRRRRYDHRAGTRIENGIDRVRSINFRLDADQPVLGSTEGNHCNAGTGFGQRSTLSSVESKASLLVVQLGEIARQNRQPDEPVGVPRPIALLRRETIE